MAISFQSHVSKCFTSKPLLLFRILLIYYCYSMLCLSMLLISYFSNVVFCNTRSNPKQLRLFTRNAAWQRVKTSNGLFVTKVTKCPKQGRLEKIPFLICIVTGHFANRVISFHFISFHNQFFDYEAWQYSVDSQCCIYSLVSCLGNVMFCN